MTPAFAAAKRQRQINNAVLLHPNPSPLTRHPPGVTPPVPSQFNEKSDNDVRSVKWNMSLPSEFAGSCMGLKP